MALDKAASSQLPEGDGARKFELEEYVIVLEKSCFLLKNMASRINA